eukprot:10392757-Ditylum_brightwellii.AAC.1
MIDQKGIDLLLLDVFAKEGILCLRYAKRQNIERMTLGANTHTIAQIQNAVRDRLRAVKNVIKNDAVVPGARAFELLAAKNLKDKVATEKRRYAKLGVETYTEALLIVPKTLAKKAGFDVQDSSCIYPHWNIPHHHHCNPVFLEYPHHHNESANYFDCFGYI